MLEKTTTREPDDPLQSALGCLLCVSVRVDLGDLVLVVTRLELLVGDPLGGGSRSRLFEHLVDLLEGKTLGFGHQQERVDKGGSAETTPDEEDGRSQVSSVFTDHVGGDDGDDGVPQPVGSGRQGNTSRSDRQGENFTDKDPGTRTPSGGEEEDEDGDEGDLGVDSGDVLGDSLTSSVGSKLVETDGDTDNGNNELTDQHAQSTPDEQRSSTELFNGVERDRGRANVDDGEDHRGQERVGDGAGRLQEGSRVVEDEVDTGPLLHHLKRCTEDGSSQVGLGGEDGSRETSGPLSEPGGGRHEGLFVFGVGDNLGEFRLDVRRRLVLSSESGKNVSGTIETAPLDEVSRGFRQEEETGTEAEMMVRTDFCAISFVMTHIRPQANWIPMGIRNCPVSDRSLVKLTTMAANINPMVIANW
jgi:hypothetical protein